MTLPHQRSFECAMKRRYAYEYLSGPGSWRHQADDFIYLNVGTGLAAGLVSGIGFDGQARRLISEYPSCPLLIPADPGTRVSGKDVFELASQGNPMCARIVDEAAEALAIEKY